MTRRLPPLSTLRAFEATARLGSVTRAAGELGRTHGAVSRQIRALQDHAGLPLFEKAGTGLRLNAHGQALQAIVTGAFDTLEQGWSRLQDEASGLEPPRRLQRHLRDALAGAASRRFLPAPSLTCGYGCR